MFSHLTTVEMAMDGDGDGDFDGKATRLGGGDRDLDVGIGILPRDGGYNTWLFKSSVTGDI